MPRRAVAPRSTALLASVLLPLLPACSLLMNTSASQCEVDADCEARSAGAICVSNVCAISGDPGPTAAGVGDDGGAGGCTSNFACEEGSVCDLRLGVCRALANEDCPLVIGSTTSATPALVIGAVVPPWTGAARTTRGTVAQAALGLAVDELDGNPRSPGIPGIGKIAMLICTDGERQTAAARVAEHLFAVQKLPLVIGSASPTQTRELFARAETAGGVVVSPGPTDVLRSEQGKGLLVQLAPSDAAQGVALARLVEEREKDVRAGVPFGEIRVYVLARDDAHGKAILQALRGTLRVNGRTVAQNEATGLFLASTYLNPANNAEREVKDALAARAKLMATAQVDVVVIAGGAEALDVVTALESAPPGTRPRPSYFLTAPAMIPELKDVIKASESLRRRVLGVAPGPKSVAGGSLYDAFLARLATKQAASGVAPGGGTTSGVAQYYDAVYAAAYLVAASGLKDPAEITGQALAPHLARLDTGVFPVLAGVDNGAPEPHARLDGVFAALRSGAGGAFQGASGVDGIDAASRAARGVVSAFCVPRGASGTASAPVFAGRYLASDGAPGLTGAATATQACGY